MPSLLTRGVSCCNAYQLAHNMRHYWFPIVMLMSILLPDFLQNPNDYVEAETVWQTLWISLPQQNAWRTPWLNTVFADGTPFMDGDPIFSAISNSGQRAVKIIQQAPDYGASHFEHWLETKPDMPDWPQQVLVISCVLSSEHLEQSKNLLAAWMRST